LQEKDVVLDIALRLGELIKTKIGAEVLYTREDDRFLELSDRPKLANNAGADLFISVHANAYSGSSVRGIETFYLNFTADPWALKVASRENAASSHSVHELQDLLGKIAMKEKIDESREFALKMQGSLYNGLSKETQGLRNRGVRQAPLIVLIGAKMPAILTEIGFLSNPTDEKLFKTSAYRAKVAEQLFSGIEGYMKSLSSHPLTMTEKDASSASLD
jgi:N-acetylmuramoyl-L-alanine amidase